MSSITTPLELYQIAHSCFLTPDIKLIQQQPLKIAMRLSVSMPAVVVDSAIQAIAFQLLCVQVATSLRQKNPIVYLDPKKFSVKNEPLRDWDNFANYICQDPRNHLEDLVIRLEDLVIRFLREPLQGALHAQLESLGLSPNIVEANQTPEHIELFSHVIDELDPNSMEMASLRERYPRLLYQIAVREVEREIQQAPQNNLYQDILNQLKQRVVGQEFALQAMTQILSRQNTQKNKVFLFVGPTGVGKTELAKAAAIFKENRLVTFNMNELTDEHAVNTLFGSPAGYVGSTDKPQFSKELEKFPAALTYQGTICKVKKVGFLFDEFEKGHPTLLKSLLNLLDNSKVTVRYIDGNSGPNTSIEYQFSQCFFVCTSNLYQQMITHEFERGASLEEIQAAFKRTNLTFKGFPPELLARMTTIPFGPIPRGENHYQRLLQIKFSAFLPQLQQEFFFRSIVIRQPAVFFRTLENRLYVNGVDIRQVNRFFDDVSGAISQHSNAWGELNRKQLCFHAQENRIFCSLLSFSDILDRYMPTHIQNVPL